MPLEEIPQASHTIEILKSVWGVVGPVITGAATYFFLKKKNKSEVEKNYADTHKSEADATKSRVETIAMLLNEVDDMIVTTKELRAKIGGLSDNREAALTIINKAIKETSDLIDVAVTTNSAQLVRLRAVGVSEKLYRLKTLLELKEVEA